MKKEEDEGQIEKYISSLGRDGKKYEKMLEEIRTSFNHAKSLNVPGTYSRTMRMKIKADKIKDKFEENIELVNGIDALQNYAQNTVIPRLSLLSTMMEHAFVMAQVNGTHYLTPEFRKRIEHLENDVIPIIERYNEYAQGIHRKFNLPNRIEKQDVETEKVIALLLHIRPKLHKDYHTIFDTLLEDLRRGKSFEKAIAGIASKKRKELIPEIIECLYKYIQTNPEELKMLNEHELSAMMNNIKNYLKGCMNKENKEGKKGDDDDEKGGEKLEGLTKKEKEKEKEEEEEEEEEEKDKDKSIEELDNLIGELGREINTFQNNIDERNYELREKEIEIEEKELELGEEKSKSFGMKQDKIDRLKNEITDLHRSGKEILDILKNTQKKYAKQTIRVILAKRILRMKYRKIEIMKNILKELRSSLGKEERSPEETEELTILISLVKDQSLIHNTTLLEALENIHVSIDTLKTATEENKKNMHQYIVGVEEAEQGYIDEAEKKDKKKMEKAQNFLRREEEVKKEEEEKKKLKKEVERIREKIEENNDSDKSIETLDALSARLLDQYHSSSDEDKKIVLDMHVISINILLDRKRRRNEILKEMLKMFQLRIPDDESMKNLIHRLQATEDNVFDDLWDIENAIRDLRIGDDIKEAFGNDIQRFKDTEKEIFEDDEHELNEKIVHAVSALKKEKEEKREEEEKRSMRSSMSGGEEEESKKDVITDRALSDIVIAFIRNSFFTENPDVINGLKDRISDHCKAFEAEQARDGDTDKEYVTKFVRYLNRVMNDDDEKIIFESFSDPYMVETFGQMEGGKRRKSAKPKKKTQKKIQPKKKTTKKIVRKGGKSGVSSLYDEIFG